VEPDGKASFAIAQAEDELAAVGMVLGAGWAGCAFHDLDLRSRYLIDGGVRRLGYFAELPESSSISSASVPSTGMPTRTYEGTCSPIAYLSHGDTKHVMLLPAFCQ